MILTRDGAGPVIDTRALDLCALLSSQRQFYRERAA